MKPISLLTLLALTFSVTLLAHHSVTSQYNIDKTVTLRGTVTRTAWTNPHTLFWVDVHENNETATWEMELPPPKALQRQGIPQDFLKPGDQVTVDTWVAKDGSKFAHPLTVHLPGGRMMNFPRDLMWKERSEN